MSDDKPMGQVIQIDEARIRDHLGELVRGTVEETLNAMLDAEADQLCGAGRYERSPARQDTRAGSYDRTLQTSAGEVKSQDNRSASTSVSTSCAGASALMKSAR
jgi:putative transposase